MEQRRADHEGGLRAFIRDQKALVGDVRLTFVQFDDRNSFELIHDGTPLGQVDESAIELIPRGGTPLLDAVGQTLTHVTKRIDEADLKPDLVVVFIITDGQENASRKWTRERVKQAIAEREQAGWKILYLGANVDAFAEAGHLGIGAPSALSYAPTVHGTAQMYSMLATNLTSTRTAWQTGSTPSAAYENLTWTMEQRGAANPSTTDHTNKED